MAELEPIFTADSAWDLTRYELFLELGPRDDDHLIACVEAIWEHPDLDGPFPERSTEPRDQPRMTAAAHQADGGSKLGGSSYGVATLPDGAQVPAQLIQWRARPEDPESSDALGTDWLLLGVPLGSLARVWPEVAPYPFLDRDEDMTSQIAWQERIEAFLVSVAADLHARLPFGFGAIGHDLVAYDETLRRLKVCRDGVVPDERDDGLLITRGAEVLWLPPTRRAGWILTTDGNGRPSTWSQLFSDSDQ